MPSPKTQSDLRATGVDYRDARLDLDAATATYPNALPFDLLTDDEALPDKSWALWADTGYAIASKWQASVGVRYYRDQVSSATDTVSFGVPQASAGQATFTSTNPRFDLSYRIASNSLLYLDVAKGFRSRGFNASYAAQKSYDPDELWTYELGSKGLYFDRKLQLEAAVYYNDWKDVQTEFFTPPGLEETTNGGRVEGEGTDLSAILNPLAGLQLGATPGVEQHVILGGACERRQGYRRSPGFHRPPKLAPTIGVACGAAPARMGGSSFNTRTGRCSPCARSNMRPSSICQRAACSTCDWASALLTMRLQPSATTRSTNRTQSSKGRSG